MVDLRVYEASEVVDVSTEAVVVGWVNTQENEREKTKPSR